MMKPSTVRKDLQSIREQSPLIHNITNFVVMQQTANALLALGASPIMAHAIDEMDDMARLAQALVLNIGTLDASWIASMQAAGRVAEDRGIPVILDPVGAGATAFRTRAVQAILDTVSPAVIRGNAAEIMAVAGQDICSKGVDSLYVTDVARSAAQMLAEKYHCTVVVSGAEDLVIDALRCVRVYNGVPTMAKVTGMGCTATALIGAFSVINMDVFDAAAHAMVVMGVTGEMAEERSRGPGSFSMHFLDVLHALNQEALETRMRVQIYE